MTFHTLLFYANANTFYVKCLSNIKAMILCCNILDLIEVQYYNYCHGNYFCAYYLEWPLLYFSLLPNSPKISQKIP